MADFIAVQIILGVAVGLAWCLGLEVTWKLMLVLGFCGFAVELKCKIQARHQAAMSRNYSPR